MSSIAKRRKRKPKTTKKGEKLAIAISIPPRRINVPNTNKCSLDASKAIHNKNEE